jgi:hypothetical protein
MTGISTGFGAWNPIAWTLLFLGIAGAAWLIRLLGRRDYKKGTEQTKAFLSGNEEPPPEQLHVRGSHLYWGLVDGLAGYYRRVRAMHTGVLSDYVAWFVGVLGVVLIILALVR